MCLSSCTSFFVTIRIQNDIRSIYKVIYIYIVYIKTNKNTNFFGHIYKLSVTVGIMFHIL